MKMTDLSEMENLRAEIDRVDSELLELIARRMQLAALVRKAKSGVNVWRPSREEAHLRDLVSKAKNTPPELVSHIWAELMSASLVLQGPICLHIALNTDALSNWSLVRDRFGASIPNRKYPTASAALAAAQADPEGIAILPAPGGMNNWWTALGSSGAANNMKIMASLPRIGDFDWPIAVALAKVPLEASGDDVSLLMLGRNDKSRAEKIFQEMGMRAYLRAEIGELLLYSVNGFLSQDEIVGIKDKVSSLDLIGVLPVPPSVKQTKT